MKRPDSLVAACRETNNRQSKLCHDRKMESRSIYMPTSPIIVHAQGNIKAQIEDIYPEASSWGAMASTIGDIRIYTENPINEDDFGADILPEEKLYRAVGQYDAVPSPSSRYVSTMEVMQEAPEHLLNRSSQVRCDNRRDLLAIFGTTGTLSHFAALPESPFHGPLKRLPWAPDYQIDRSAFISPIDISNVFLRGNPPTVLAERSESNITK